MPRSKAGGWAKTNPMELRLCVGARTSRIGDHNCSRRCYACTACPALLEPRTLMTNHLSQARAFRALRRRVVMRALRVRCCPRLPMIQRCDHTARAQCSLLHRALARRARASTSTPLGDRSFVPIPLTDGIWFAAARCVDAASAPPTCALPRARFAPCTLVWHAGRHAHFAVPCARRRRVVFSRTRQRKRDERPLRSAELRSPRRAEACVVLRWLRS